MMLICVTLILVGCSTNEEPSKDENNNVVEEENENNEKENEQNENLTDEDQNLDEENNEELTNEDEEVVGENEEDAVKEPLYRIVGITDFEPIDDANPKAVLITIDDAPDQYALEMATVLKQLDVPAIFFVNGIFVATDEKKEILKEIHDMGFAIGNHTYSHKNLQQISNEEQYEEITKLNELIEDIIGEKPKFFRAPHGANTDYTKQLIKDEGMLLMNWTYGYDYFEPYMDAESLAEAMVTGKGPEVGVDYSLLKPGANLLMHDRKWTYEALPAIIEGLREQGYEFIDPDTILIENE